MCPKSNAHGSNLCCHITLYLLKLIRHTHYTKITKMRSEMCENDGTNSSRINSDVDFTRVLETPLTLDIDFLDGLVQLIFWWVQNNRN